jgi:hypothetical protein
MGIRGPSLAPQIGFDWLCFFALPAFSVRKRHKLALFDANDDSAENGDWYVLRSGLYLSPLSESPSRNDERPEPPSIGFDWVRFSAQPSFSA